MSQALQVSFRRVLPSEPVVALAAQRFRHVHRARPDVRECCVVVEAMDEKRPKLVQAVVTLRGEHADLAESTGVHRDGHAALALAFASAEARLGIFPALDDPRWTLGPEPLSLRAAGSR